MQNILLDTIFTIIRIQLNIFRMLISKNKQYCHTVRENEIKQINLRYTSRNPGTSPGINSTLTKGVPRG